MNLNEIIAQDQELGAFLVKTNKVEKSLLTGISESSLPLLVNQLVNQDKSLILVLENENKAEQVLDNLSGILDEEQVAYFPVDPTLATQKATASPDELSQRIKALTFLASGKSGIVITCLQGLQYELAPKEQYCQTSLSFTNGEEVEFEKLATTLFNLGYRKEAQVARPGEFSQRGDILDIYPLDFENPVRIEFFGDEVDTVKNFDVNTQRSLTDLTTVDIAPASDRIFTSSDLKRAYNQLKDAGVDESELGDLAKGILPDNYSFLVDFLLQKKVSLLSYLADDGLVMFYDWPVIKKQGKMIDDQNADFLAEEVANHQLIAGQKLRLDLKQVLKDQHSRLYLSLFQKGMGNLRLDQLLNWTNRVPEQFFSQMPMIKTELNKYQKQGLTVILQADNLQRAKQMQSNLADFDLDFPQVKPDNLKVGQTQIIVGQFNQGFYLPSVNLMYLTERELFNQTVHKKRKILNLENAQRLRNYNDLKPGDYVVHINHGIGRFEGIQTLEVDGQKRDYITITYQHHDQLFVPADQLSQVQKYVASEGKRPHINKLGGSQWAKTKRSVQSKVEDIADDLIKLYAARESEKGFAFSKDNDLQREFEAAFPYVPTPDQERSSEEIKRDMEKPRAMDRLLVGDVGFGKTEVAIRAAFKAIQDGKQVAFLVPTTILAQQHFDNISERFKDFPVNVALLSRFQTNKESKEICEQLEEGKIDLVVGTHRLLSKDVVFKDLGLLIIDEEQRFGVKHKERLKELKNNVDVLTLTATPIPRTLHMSMVGVRDLSVMETPPVNRYPVQTYVTEQVPSVVRQACLREMERDGQIFYLHNRIDDIDDKVMELEQLLPEAKIEAIHGRMTENQMSDILYRFLNKEFDILVTTTIIETGIDMPNVNTLIIENADHYGLSQLYQLRGRIGRSARLAYAYFLYAPNKVLTEVGEKRLEAIRDFTELGSGFKIAMRDLSIRGAGNMLGKEQHGFIDSVGYDLYAQMLDDAIKARKGKKAKPKSNSEIELGLEAYIPDEYISDQEQKIEFYKKIKQVASDEQIQAIEDELLDRFGDYPKAVETLLDLAKLKLVADCAGIDKIIKTKQIIKIEFNSAASSHLKGPNVFKALEHVSLRAKVAEAFGHLVVSLDASQVNLRILFKELTTFVDAAGELIEH
ncbi:transcription-repair coupling factor [Lactobacillus psittaci]|uniref:Transcription-repair-coupling factor n=1 Tax=Lactobacillus psittaci DSM 15354 TaxID=1122152 RepID=A0A0R1S4R9_9LACO|nr:transcription-repair coupling factor [Lactobacillus psittaci]KRL62564.1 transcription-repair coupling factor [Lactobacillus psittaci DSM 15354]